MPYIIGIIAVLIIAFYTVTSIQDWLSDDEVSYKVEKTQELKKINRDAQDR